MSYPRLKDVSDIRKHLRMFIRFHKKSRTLQTQISGARFLGEIKREIESYLDSRGLIHAKKNKRAS